jgi:hypothetical protein
MGEVSEQLIDDHAALDKVLKQLQAALRTNDLEVAHAKLDLFWARLAVHIRAEHLHLFPAVLNAAISHRSAPSLEEAQTVTSQLHDDHDFFMHGLARAVEITRKLLTVSEPRVVEEKLNEVKNIVSETEKRLVMHNEVEENQIYKWVTILLNPENQSELAKQITAELRKHPPRFTLGAWLNA